MYSLPSTVSLSAKALLIGTRKMQTDPEPTRESEAGANLGLVRPPSLLEMDGHVTFCNVIEIDFPTIYVDTF